MNEICVDTTVEVKAGWEFTQDNKAYTGTKKDGVTLAPQYYYKLRAQPYVYVDALIVPKILIDKLYTNELTADLDSFKSYVFGEMLYF